YPVQLDTGSSDLWIKGAVSPLPNTIQTARSRFTSYGIGWAQGNLAFAPVEFAGISVASQALLDASSVQNPALGYGAVGILGLGFTSLSSIDSALNASGSSKGRSLLFNLFQDNPSEPNFISFALQRSTEPNDEVEGSFSIGEYEPEYAAIAQNAAISTWPPQSPTRWTVLVEAVLVGTSTVIPATSIGGVPSNRALVLLDSGTSWTYAPKAICDAIYSGVPGAFFSNDISQWVVPCDAEIDIAIQMGFSSGQVFPVHPLDVAPYSLSDTSTCVGSFVPQSVAVGAGEFDWLIGDNFLRSVYSVYDFGDFDSSGKMGDPYVKLLSLVDPNNGSAEFVKVRGGVAKTNIIYHASNTPAGSPVGSASITVSDDLSKTLDKITTYIPAMLAIMAFNALVLAAVLIVGIVYLCRRRKRTRSPRARSPNGRITPMRISARNSYVPGTNVEEPHVYEPISMAITEDTMFLPPSPGFRQFDGQAGDRPKSLATLPSQSKLYQKIGSEDALSPPSFSDNNRPKSMGMSPTSEDTIYPPKAEPLSRESSDDASIKSGKSAKSGRSGRSGVSLVDEGVLIPTLPSNPDDRPSRPASVFTSERPGSVAVPPPAHSAEDILLPPPPRSSLRPQSAALSGSPELRPNRAALLAAQRPQSAALSSPDASRIQSASLLGPQQPRYPPPNAPHSAGARFAGGSSLRPNARFAVGAERPMSVGTLPSQAQPGDPRFAGPSPQFHRQGSSLRPGAGSAGLQEEDITTFTPPTPAFRRPTAGSSSNDRPMSLA
ncbi:aspartic peptidase domain-containing protein, partial [Mycena floridula]